ncbi:MAG: Nicotinamide-nucleotide amidohydrolase PncC [Legionellaceae bacterium]
MSIKNDINRLALEVGNSLFKLNMKLVTAESCTGGKIAAIATMVAGSSAWFERGYVTYSIESKQELLSVNPETIKTYGVVSEETVLEMAQGALKNSHADIALATTGYAGPGGGESENPVGTIYFAWLSPYFPIKTIKHYFKGDRESITDQAILFSLENLKFLVRNL